VRIVFTAPFWSPEINSICRAPIFLSTQGHDILIITAQKANSLKGRVTAPASEFIEGAEFFRPYPDSKDLTWRPQMCWPEVKEKISGFKPEVVVGFGDPFYRLPLKLSRHLNVPLVMFFEYLRLNKFSLPFRGSGKINKFFPKTYRLCAGLFRRYLAKQCSAIMFSYYGDQSLIPEVERHCPIVQYVPWCTETSGNPEGIKRNYKTGIYIGSLEKFKNSAELVKAIPIILDQTDTERFIVVGPGEYAVQIQQLTKKYGNRLEYVESVSRFEAMKMLQSAGYGYTPVTDCGLGFIGDCWGTGTPLLTTHGLDGFLQKDIDTIVVNGIHNLPQKINSLLNSKKLFKNLQNGGYKRYLSDYSARSVSEKYLKILLEVVNSKRI